MREPPAPIDDATRRHRQATLVCASCGARFVGWYVRRYCSDRCEQQAAEERRRLADSGHSARRSAAWCRANPEAARRDDERSNAQARERRAAMPPEERARINAAATARGRGYQRASLELAENYRTPWTDDGAASRLLPLAAAWLVRDPRSGAWARRMPISGGVGQKIRIPSTYFYGCGCAPRALSSN